jgi:plasmid stabilization system protein ParE
MYQVKITDIAEEDILSTVKYISNELKAPIAANNLLDEIEKYEKILEKTPNMYSFVPDDYLRLKKVRFVGIKNYLMFYIIEEDKEIVNVIRFLYGRRDWKNILKETEENKEEPNVI